MKILGILNITEDSFSDGGKFLEPTAALAQADRLLVEGADILDIGAASSHPDAKPVPPEIEIARLAAVVPALHDVGASLSIDSFSLPVQRWALSQGVDYLNDIHGFADPALYPELTGSNAKLIVMHMVQERGIASRTDIPPDGIFDRILSFFEKRLTALTGAGIAMDRLILDPGMGFFLSTNPQTSLTVLGRLPELAEAFGLPLLVSVSRKSFLKALERAPEKCAAVFRKGARPFDNLEQDRDPGERDPAPARPGQGPEEASVAAEMFAVAQGADYIRTHAPAPLREGLKVLEELGNNR